MLPTPGEEPLKRIKRVLFVYDGDWPKAATRVRKLTKALSTGGYSVRLVCRNESKLSRRGREDWMTIRRLPAFPLKGLNRFLNFPFFFSPIWFWVVFSETRSWGADAIVVEDLPLAPTAVLIGRLRSIPVVYDMGEVYPEFLRGLKQFKRRTLADRVIRNPRPAEILERFVLSRADWTSVVSQESMARALRVGADPERISVVGNTPENPEELRRAMPGPLDLEGLDRRSLILFVGILISDRGLVQAVQAMELVRRSRPDAVLMVVGDGLERERIESEIVRLNLQKGVILLGWKDPEYLPGYYQSARVGLLPFLDGGQIRITLANKLFDYLGAGLPVVASDVPPMRRILEECGAGVLVEPGNPAALAAGILKVLEAPQEEWNRMSAAGIATVSRSYRWELDRDRFLMAMKSLARDQNGQ